MIRRLLDTSAYSAFKRGHSGVIEAVRESDELFFDPIVLGELHAGFLKGNRTESNLEELKAFLGSVRVSVLPIDAETSERYAVILRSLQQAGNPIPTNDVWIAASAMQHGARVLTTDRHFLLISRVIVDYYDARIPAG